MAPKTLAASTSFQQCCSSNSVGFAQGVKGKPGCACVTAAEREAPICGCTAAARWCKGTKYNEWYGLHITYYQIKGYVKEHTSHTNGTVQTLTLFHLPLNTSLLNIKPTTASVGVHLNAQNPNPKPKPK